MSESLSILILGGTSKVSLHLSTLFIQSGTAHNITSVIRDSSKAQSIIEVGAKPKALSLEDASIQDLIDLLNETGADVVYWVASAIMTNDDERMRKVDFEGAVKVFDAIDALEGDKPRLIVVSGIDIGNVDRFPEHYNEEDKKVATFIRTTFSSWWKWKYEAEKILVKRTSFEWIILRPGELLDNPGTGKASIGRTHLTATISREDVALALFHLATVPVKAAGLAIDMDGGGDEITEAIDRFIELGVTDWLGEA